MPSTMQRLVHTMRMHARSQAASELSDRQLLKAFATDADEAAFAEIVRRHGALVLGICRRILGNVQDAEDAFQATFLVLARKADSLNWRDSIKNWLHGVACRIAMKARSQAHRRRLREQAAVPAESNAPADAWSELRGVLDEEMAQLPARYRDVLILCYLEGKARDEAAELLGWSIGSVKGRLERGRELLRSRLCKRGLTLSAALCAGLLSDAAVSAASVPAALQFATVESASLFVAGTPLVGSITSLAQGALHTMMIAKIKIVAFAMLMLSFGTTAFVGVYQAGSTGGGSISFTAAAHAQERGKDEKKKSSDYFGLIKEIDLKVGIITLTPLKDGDREEQKFSLASKDLKIVSNFGQTLKTTDLAVGHRVHLELKALDVASITVEHPTFPGFISKIDAEKRTIEARGDRRIGTYQVAPDAKIVIAGKVTKLAAVPLEERVILTLSFDKKTILAMNAKEVRRDGEKPKEKVGDERRKGEKDQPKGEREPGMTEATIVDVDASKSTVNVLLGRGGEIALRTLTVSKDLKIKVSFAEQSIKEVSVAQLAKPLQAMITMSEDKKAVTAMSVVAPTIRASVKAIDVTGRKITLITGEREAKTFAVDADVAIRMTGRAADKLAAIEPGMSVIVGLSFDRQRVIGIVVQMTRRDGDR